MKPKTYRERGEEPKKNRSVKIEDDLYIQFQTHAAKLGLGFSAWAVNALLDRMNEERMERRADRLSDERTKREIR